MVSYLDSRRKEVFEERRVWALVFRAQDEVAGNIDWFILRHFNFQKLCF